MRQHLGIANCGGGAQHRVHLRDLIGGQRIAADYLKGLSGRPAFSREIACKAKKFSERPRREMPLDSLRDKASQRRTHVLRAINIDSIDFRAIDEFMVSEVTLIPHQEVVISGARNATVVRNGVRVSCSDRSFRSQNSSLARRARPDLIHRRLLGRLAQSSAQPERREVQTRYRRQDGFKTPRAMRRDTRCLRAPCSGDHGHFGAAVGHTGRRSEGLGTSAGHIAPSGQLSENHRITVSYLRTVKVFFGSRRREKNCPSWVASLATVEIFRPRAAAKAFAQASRWARSSVSMGTGH